ncbi:MAG TPA: group II intron reverse transcriptase/maturase [Syntrophorhabdales bacterium]|nr:group II intron reverse transcriptase/maturase [Syntrophorhabdales bacterium]
MTEKSANTDAKADKAWLLSVQRKLYQWSREHPEGTYRDLWNWIVDSRNMRCAWRTVAANRGKRTPGIDGVTVSRIRKRGVDAYLERIRDELHSGSYKPSPSRRVWIPKPGKPGKFRPLGIITVKDRIVQCAVKQIVEPLFEARFWHVSYGFRPGRSCHGALEHIRLAMRPTGKADEGKRLTFPCQYVIETDIMSCFDQISHHQAMERIRRRSGDRKVNRLILKFLKAGVLSEDQIIRTDVGTQQGGILSPLIANVALSVIEEKYERWVHHQKKLRSRRTCDGIEAAGHARMTDRKAGRPVFFPIRYADDSVVLVSGTYDDAVKEKESLARYLKETASLVLSEEKTRITATDKGFEFLGHRIRMKWDDRYGYSSRIEIPKQKVKDFRHRVKELTTRSTTTWSLETLLRQLNPILRGWSYFYRFCAGAKPILHRNDQYVRDRLYRWIRKKHPGARLKVIMRYHRSSSVHPGCRVWREGKEEQFLMGYLTVQRFKRGWMRQPEYALISGEPSA